MTEPLPNSGLKQDDAGSALDIQILLDSVARVFGASGRKADEDWPTAVGLGLPLLCSDRGMGGLEDALQIGMELGRLGVEIPLIESQILNLIAPDLVPQDGRVAMAFGDAGGDAGCGQSQFTQNTVSGRLRLVEGAGTAEYLVLFDAGTATVGTVRCDSPGVIVERAPALASELYDVTLNVAPLERTRVLKDSASLASLMRLGLCARALGAATRGFDAVTDYAKVRRQFGQTIGSFQALQHKLADSKIMLDASRLLLMSAARAWDIQAPNRAMLADAAVAYASPSLRKVSLETQHCFGAIGFAEEHEAPALFRRVHADTVRLGGGKRAAARLGVQLIHGGKDALAMLMAAADDPAVDFRLRLRAWLGENWTSADQAGLAEKVFEAQDWDLDFVQRLGRDGWTALTWPASAGGMAAGPFELLAFIEELQLAGAPGHAMICPCRIIAPEIIAHGSDRLKQELLPLIRAGSVTGCLGYSEPEAGSDLASLKTKARRDGNEYRIDGQKLWTTDGHRASHMILAARTDADPQTKHGGISLFVLPMDRPGISIRPMTGLHGHVFCSIFFDDVRVPADFRLGEEGQGWAILSAALANERITMGAFVSRLAVLLGQMIAAVREDAGMRDDAAIIQSVGDLAARLVAGRELAMASIRLMDRGVPPLVEAAEAKIYASELAQLICETGLDLFGGRALLGATARDVPADGMMEEILRLSIMYVVGGGSNEIQRTLIATRGLGLGR